jgi:peptidoglycan hydrolase-like amidase
LAFRTAGGKAQRYAGQIYVTVDRRGSVAVVNAVAADELLAGLVPAEIFPKAPMAALEAQAVAARTELLAKIGTRHFEDPYLVCATNHCQVYRGMGHEHPRTTSAISATRGLVLVRPNGQLADAVYSASCGGSTEDNDRVWPLQSDANLRGHLDAPLGPSQPTLHPFRQGITESNLAAWLAQRPPSWCGRTKLNQDKLRWSKTVDLPTLNRLVQPLGLGAIKDIQVLERGVSGRALRVKLQGSHGNHLLRGELKIRQGLGDLRSSMFIVTPLRLTNGTLQGFNFSGGGWGHGVGLCQTGAIGMAEAGKTAREILRHYYTQSEIQPLY